MTTCTHDLTDCEVACAADGMCPLCLAARVRELEAERVDWARRFKLSDVTPWEWMTRAERAEAERDALRALLRRVLSCGLNEDPPGSGFTPSRQERIAGELARDISDALAGGKP